MRRFVRKLRDYLSPPSIPTYSEKYPWEPTPENPLVFRHDGRRFKLRTDSEVLTFELKKCWDIHTAVLTTAHQIEGGRRWPT